MQRILLVAWGLAGLTACVTDEPEITSHADVASASFVRTATDAQGRPRFASDGLVFRFIGGNTTELPWMDPAAQDHELQWAHDVGFRVVRVWGVDDAESADQMASRLRGVLDRAAAHGLHVTIALTHNYHQPNWLDGSQSFHAVPGDARPNAFTSHPNGFYSRDCGSAVGLWCLDDSWVDWGYTAFYRDYATRLVALLADHPAIFSWDIANETSGSSRDAWIVSRVTAFYVDMAHRIKLADPNHLVTTGMISTSWAGMADAQRDAVYASPDVDYLTVHEYEPLNTEAQDDEVWRARNRFGKPVVIEEYGARSTAAAQQYYAARLHPANPAFEVTGLVYWGVASPQYPEVTDGVWSPQALGAYDWFVAFWQGWGARLGAEAQLGGDHDHGLAWTSSTGGR
jgi:endo-1,4-beta-mannosidase